MVDPTLRVRLPVQRGILHIEILVTGPIKIQVPDRRGLARQRVRNVHLGEERRVDQVHVLSAHRPEAHHAQRGEAAHGPAVVVAGDPADGVVELAGDVKVAIVRREARAARVVEEVDHQERLLVADVVEPRRVVEVPEALDERVRPAQGGDELGHVVWDVEGVQPRRTLVRLVAVLVQIARGEVEQQRTEGGILVPKGPVQVSRHEEAGEAAFDQRAIDGL